MFHSIRMGPKWVFRILSMNTLPMVVHDSVCWLFRNYISNRLDSPSKTVFSEDDKGNLVLLLRGSLGIPGGVPLS